MIPDSRPESWRELWQSCTRAERRRLLVILGAVLFTAAAAVFALLAVIAVTVAVLAGLAA